MDIKEIVENAMSEAESKYPPSDIENALENVLKMAENTAPGEERAAVRANAAAGTNGRTGEHKIIKALAGIAAVAAVLAGTFLGLKYLSDNNIELLKEGGGNVTVTETNEPAVTAAPMTTAATAETAEVTTSAGTIWDDKIPEFETETDRLKRLYPEMFDLLPASIGLSLAYKTNDSGEWTYTLYDTDDMISFALEHPGEKYDVDSIHFISADEMRTVLRCYDKSDMGYIVHFDETKKEFETADAETAAKICEIFGLAEEAKVPAEETVEHIEYKVIPIQEKYLSDRLPAAGEGAVFSNNMIVVCGSDLYQYVNFGAIPYKRVSELLSSYSLSPADVSSVWNAMKPVCEDDVFVPEKAEKTLTKTRVYDYFTNEEHTAVTFYRLTDNFIISVGNDEWGTGVRILQKLTDQNTKYNYSDNVHGVRRIFELLWKAAEEQPDKFGNMSIVFVRDIRDTNFVKFGYYVEAVIENEADRSVLYDYMQSAGADISLYTVLTPEEERETYLPIRYYHTRSDGTFEMTDPQLWNGYQYISVGDKVFNMTYGTSESLEAVLEQLSAENAEIKKKLEKTPLEELRVTPNADVFDPILMPYSTDSVYYDLGACVIEVKGIGKEWGVTVCKWDYDFKMTNVRKVVLHYLLHPVWNDEGEGVYMIDRLDFIADDSGEKPRVYIRITADKKYHEAIRKNAENRKFGEFYYEIESQAMPDVPAITGLYD